MQNKIVDYRKFRFKKLATPEFSHLLYLIYWAAFGLCFSATERLFIRDFYFPISCSIDNAIPFCELFLIPYMFWFIYMVGIHAYTLFLDIKSFRNMMQFIMITYTIALLTYIIFPNCQQLRPESFERDNFLTSFMIGFYRFDTSTNVCPSMHVIGSVAVSLCAWNLKHFKTVLWRIAFSITTVLISISTVFLKQHSVIDVAAAVPVCIIGYWLVYKRKAKKPQEEKITL